MECPKTIPVTKKQWIVMKKVVLEAKMVSNTVAMSACAYQCSCPTVLVKSNK